MLNQHLLLQAGTGGVRQLLFPLNFTPGRGGSSPRFIQVRQVTMGGQSGVLSFPARFSTPITMRAVTHQTVNVTQTGQPVQQTVTDQLQTVTPVVTTTIKPATISSGDTPVVIATEVSAATQVVFVKLCWLFRTLVLDHVIS